MFKSPTRKHQVVELNESEDMVNDSGLDNNDSRDTPDLSEPVVLGTVQKTINIRQKYPWRKDFLTTFNWLRYDELNKTARCSFAKCNMYHTL